MQRDLATAEFVAPSGAPEITINHRNSDSHSSSHSHSDAHSQSPAIESERKKERERQRAAVAVIEDSAALQQTLLAAKEAVLQASEAAPMGRQCRELALHADIGVHGN